MFTKRNISCKLITKCSDKIFKTYDDAEDYALTSADIDQSFTIVKISWEE